MPNRFTFRAMFVLASALSVSAASAMAQQSDPPARCLAYPEIAAQARALHAGPQPTSDIVDFPRIIVDKVTIDPTSRLTATEREALTMALTSLSEGAVPDWTDKVRDAYVRRFLGDHGYFGPQPEVSFVVLSTTANEQHVSLAIVPNEGPKLRMGTFAVRSGDPAEPVVFSQEQIRETLKLREGDIFNRALVSDSLGKLHDLYQSRGYLDFVATPIVHINEQTHELDFTYEVSQGAQFRVGAVAVETTSDKARSAITTAFPTGSVFDGTLLAKLLDENASTLPPGVSPEDVAVSRNTKSSTVNMTFHLNPCPPHHD